MPVERAKEAGIDEDTIEEARDGEDPKAELIALIKKAGTDEQSDLAKLNVRQLRGALCHAYAPRLLYSFLSWI